MNDLAHTFEDAGDFYIHYNKIHIGLRGNRSNLTSTFAEQKKIVIAQLKQDYIKNFNANLSNSSIEAMALATGVTEEEFLTTFNKDFTQQLQDSLSINKLQQLHSIISKPTIGDKQIDFNNKLQNIIDKKSVKDLEIVFQVIKQALDLLEQDKNGSLGAILINSLEESQNNITKVGKNLQKLLESYKISANYKTIKKQSLQSAKSMLQNLGYVLETGKFKSTGSDLSVKGLSRLLLNCLVSTSIAEGLSVASYFKAGHVLYDAMAQIVGSDQILIQSNNQDDYKITGKTDVKVSGVDLSLQGYDDGKDGGGIKIDIGISSKFYKGQKFNSNLNSPQGTYGSGSGGTLGEALRAIWDDPIDRYLVYNFFTHQMHQSEFNDLIATRQIVRLFASAGSESDFAQFMLINGKIVSIWSLVKYAISTDLSISASGKSQAGIVLSIPNRPKIFNSNKYELIGQSKKTMTLAAWNRSRKINSEINSARIKAELHLNKIAKAMS